MSRLQVMFNPKTIALIGATEKEGAIGRTILKNLLSTLSKESLRTRFFSSIQDISHEWLILFCNIDYDRHMAIVAEMEENGKKSMIGTQGQ